MLKLLALVVTLNFAQCTQLQNLNGVWQLTNSQYNVPAIVPGGVYTDLENNGIITDPFFNYNDIDTRWVAKDNWTYSYILQVAQSTLNHDQINLVFDGVDTFATILVNDVEIATTDNMFVKYVFDVKAQLQLGDNNLTVAFTSPILMANFLFDQQLADYLVPPVCIPAEQHGECHANHVRKMQASFAWDWGPAFPSMGIWKNVFLEAYNSSVIRDSTVNILLNQSGTDWDMEFTTYFASNKNDVVQGTLTIIVGTDVEAVTNIYSVNVSANSNQEFVSSNQFFFNSTYVSLWWPNGYGPATLYDVSVTFVSEDQTETSEKTFKVGFRTIELVQNSLINGSTFYFNVNNVPIFAKGSNVIPVNILPERGGNPETVKFLLQSAKDVHMNMLRVWGGGMYESDLFYQTADELGLMIWQDFMFASSMYPVTSNFLSSVVQEVRTQVRRLQNHPSVVVWAANNENEICLSSNLFGTSSDFAKYKADYVTLYVNNTQNEVQANDNTRYFLTSSPTNGLDSIREGYVATDPQSVFFGDVHFYNYVLDSWDSDTYPITRFASEFGYQSLPSLRTWSTATTNVSDLQFNSEFLVHRQHHFDGYTRIRNLIEARLQLPNDNATNFLNAFIYYSQIQQAMAIKIESEFYRQWRGNLNSEFKGLTMGALYWQLNDVWVAPTWAGIDFTNKWKMLHYFARNFFAPVIVTGYLATDRNLTIYAVSDEMAMIPDGYIRIFVHKWDNFAPIYETSVLTQILPGYSSPVMQFGIDDFLSQAGCGDILTARTQCFIYLKMTNLVNVPIAPENFVFPTPLKDAPLPQAKLTISSVQQTDTQGLTFTVTLRTDAITLFVWLDSNQIRGTFSDNGFLQIEPVKTVEFQSESPTTIADLVTALTVTHLLDPQYFV